MVECTRASTKTTKKMVLEHFFGQMEESMWDAGKKENSTVEASITWPMARKKLANGSRENGSNGYRRKSDHIEKWSTKLFQINYTNSFISWLICKFLSSHLNE